MNKHSLVHNYLNLPIKVDEDGSHWVNADQLEAEIQKSPMQINNDGTKHILLLKKSNPKSVNEIVKNDKSDNGKEK